MYSDVLDRLGFTQSTMETIVFVGIIIAVIGVVLVLYWKYIVMGTLALGCVAVMANHKSTVKEPTKVPVIEKEEVINQVKPVEVPIPLDDMDSSKIKPVPSDVQPTSPKTDEAKDIRREFMEKCINLADYTKTQCDELWDDRVKEERELLENTKFKGKKHGNYRKA